MNERRKHILLLIDSFSLNEIENKKKLVLIFKHKKRKHVKKRANYELKKRQGTKFQILSDNRSPIPVAKKKIGTIFQDYDRSGIRNHLTRYALRYAIILYDTLQIFHLTGSSQIR